MKIMTREFIHTLVFDKCWEELNLNDDNLSELQNFILLNPLKGDVIIGTGGLRKLRWNFPNRGKRGGIRVLYVDFIYHEKVILIDCYSKKEKDDISSKEKILYKELIKQIEEELYNECT